jgi:thiol:disulfide interchange protein DsbD
MPSAEVSERLRDFVRVRLYTDFVPIKTLTEDQRLDLGEDNLVFEQELVNQTTSPLYVIVDPSGGVLAQKAYDPSPAAFVTFLKDGLAKFQGNGGKMASR